MTEIRSKVLSGIKWSAGAKFSTQLLTWISTIIVMRLLSPDDYGLMAMATVFIGLCLLVNELGLGVALVQAKEVSDRMLKQAFGLVLLFNALIVIALLLTAPLIASSFDESRVTLIVRVLASQFLIMSFIVVPRAMLNRGMDFKAISLVEVVTQIINSVATLILAWKGFSIWSLIFGSLIGSVVRTIAYNIAYPFIKLPTFNFSGFRDAAKFGGFLSLQQILWYIYSQADVFIIGRILGKTMLGYYSVAMHIASLPMQKVGSIINSVALPAYSRLQDDRKQVAEYAAKTSRVISVIVFPLFFGISAIAPEIVKVVLGEKWLPAIIPLQLLSMIVPLRTIQISLVPAVNGLGRPDVNARNVGIACIVLPLAFYIGVQYGLTGICIGWIVGYSAWFSFMLTQSLPVLSLPIKRFLKTLILPMIFSGLMWVVIYYSRIGLSGFIINDSIMLAILIPIGGIAYIASIFAFSRDTLFELWDLRKS